MFLNNIKVIDKELGSQAAWSLMLNGEPRKVLGEGVVDTCLTSWP